MSAAKDIGHTIIDDIGKYEALIISTFIIMMGLTLITHSIDQTTFAGLMGAFIGYTFGRIFNHTQGKE